MSKRGIIQGLDDGYFKQSRIDGQEQGGGNGPLMWLTRKVIETFSKEGKDERGKDIDALADLEAHIDRTMKRVGCKDDGSNQAQWARAAAIETYGAEKELAARDIRPYHTGEKFFGAGAENSPLFPAMLASSFIVTRLSAGLADLMVFADVPTDRLSVDKVRLNELADERQMRNVGIGEPLPQAELSHLDTNVKMRKYGRFFTYAREVVRMQPLAVVQAFVAQIARQVAVDETDEVLEILHAGDGETGSAVTDTACITDGTLVYGDLIALELAFNNNYAGRVFLSDSANFLGVLKMSEYKDPLASRGVAMDRNIPSVPTPSGMGRIYRWQSTNSTFMAETGGRIAAVDPSLAASIHRTPLLQEQDTYIDRGKEGVALSYMCAVVKGDPDCFHSLDIIN